MFGRHDVITVAGDPVVLKKVVWIDPAGVDMAVLELGRALAWPELVDLREASMLVATGAWSVTEGDLPMYPAKADVPRRWIEKRDADMAVVETLVGDDVRPLFVKRSRATAVSEAMGIHGLSRPTVERILRRYLSRGMAKGALLPDWSTCGAPGVSRPAAPEAVKRGRPPATGHPVGLNVDADLTRLFLLCYDLYYARERKHSMIGAYRLCVRHHLSVEVENEETGRLEFVPREQFADTGLPTYGQFLHVVKRDRCRLAAMRSRLKPRVFDQRTKPLLNTSAGETWGPCARFQIDATVLDVYVRSRRLRRMLIRRPTLYVVIDVFSRMIVGVYIGLEPPSWVGAMMALANAVEPKAAFCARFGIDIEEEEWPAHHLCATLLGDRGEIEGALAEHMIELQNVSIETAAAYRGDWKGVVESRFRILHVAMRPFVPGYVETDFRERGAQDYRLDAALDIDELTAVVIRLVLFHNNHHELKRYDRSPGMTEDGVASVPIELWNWGIANKTGRPRSPRPAAFRFSLMPRRMASVTAEGIEHEGRFYTCQKAIDEQWFRKTRLNGVHKVPVSYDKRTTDTILVHDKRSPDGFQVGTLTVRSRDRAGLTGAEAEALNREERRISACRRDGELLARVATEAGVERIAQAAVERTGDLSGVSARAQVADVRAQSAAELARDRRDEAVGFSPVDCPGATNAVCDAVVVPIRPAADTVSRPDFRTRLEGSEE